MGDNDKALDMLFDQQQKMMEHILAIRDELAEHRGERRVAIWGAGAIGGSLGAITTLAYKLAPFFGHSSK